ncbi:hypothetical protein AS180_17900 [Priestia veravalensis]|uniref:Uncharacterized protein n=1 Tax=Priestia veravalensis TaxID=1414648 RepID=A0A0V8JHQ5_9BACI|nr:MULTISPECIES: hypothetical protein [Priestia]KSU86561.1 hypothetical protein AS180_17900 [Priestia veravalensis]SCC50711.1 hypothetical protein GA0061087_106611 [Priestia flexa]
MATSKKNITISSEMKKLKTILRQIPKERLPIGQSLYNELVFMQNTLDKLKQQVEEEGAVSMFKQGRQEFLREHPALKAYNTTVQRYSLLYKQLVDLLPPTDVEQPQDALIDFLKG